MSNHEASIKAIADTLSASVEARKKLDDRLVSELRLLSASNSAAKDLFYYLAHSSTQYRQNSAAYLQLNSGIDYNALIQILKKLDSISVGNFVVGRKGKETRLEWLYHPKYIAKCALGEKVSLYHSMKKLDGYDGGEEAFESHVEHTFRLRPDYQIDLVLPEDFNRKDLERLSKWLDTIPFD